MEFLWITQKDNYRGAAKSINSQLLYIDVGEGKHSLVSAVIRLTLIVSCFRINGYFR